MVMLLGALLCLLMVAIGAKENTKTNLVPIEAINSKPQRNVASSITTSRTSGRRNLENKWLNGPVTVPTYDQQPKSTALRTIIKDKDRTNSAQLSAINRSISSTFLGTKNTASKSIDKSKQRFSQIDDILVSKNKSTTEIPTIRPREDIRDSYQCRQIDAPTKSICPEGFLDVERELCLLIKTNQPFPPICPYPHFMNALDLRGISDTYFMYENIWMQAYRNTSSGFIDFEWMENKGYGITITQVFFGNINDVRDKNCIVRRNRQYYRVSCSEKHTALCAYSYLRLLTSSAIDTCRNEGYAHCILSHYDLTQPTCFCQKVNRFQPAKNSFCAKLAEPISSFQTQLLIENRVMFSEGASKCWIGLHKEESTGLYKWSSANHYVNYTHWATPYNCKFSEGAFQFDNYTYGWVLVKHRSLRCAICEIKPHFKEPVLLLEMDAESKLLLYVFNLNTVSNLAEEWRYDIYCFSDYNDNTFKKLLNYYEYQNASFGIFELSVAVDRPSYYWCEAFHYMSSTVVKSNTVITNWAFGYGHEYSIHIRANVTSKYDPFLNKLHIKICEHIKKQIEAQYDSLIISLRPMRAYFDDIALRMNMTAHLTTKTTSETATDEYSRLFKILKTTSIVVDFFSSEVCLLTTSSTPNGEILVWPETRIGAMAIPSNKLCLDEARDLLPVRRKCEGDFLHGGKWGKTIGTCYRNETYPEVTEELFNLLTKKVSAENLTADLLRITQKEADKRPIDIHLIAENLEKLAAKIEEEVDSRLYCTIVSNLMHFQRETLKHAQHLLNSTDKILSIFDSFLNNENSTTIVLPKLIVQVTDLQDTNISGVALFKQTPNANSFEQYKISLLFHNTSIDNLTRNECLEIAAFLPSEVLNDNRTKKLVITVFYNDFLFNEQRQNNYQTKTKITSISIPGIKGFLKFPIKILFKTPEEYFGSNDCSYWQYGMNSLALSVHGQWKIDGSSKANISLLEECEFFHMTHFGNLLLKNKSPDNHDRALEILTAVGSALSLIGIIPIYATAVCFKKWRTHPGNIILINFCAAITLQIIMTLSLHSIKEDGVLCKVVGVFLHYSILSEFSWMLVIAHLQYKRYVDVFKPREGNIVKKSLFVGWSVPLIPVAITLCMSSNSYAFNEQKFCYLRENYFNFGLIFPIVLILTINVVVFAIIIHNILQSNVPVCIKRKRDYKEELLLACLLFFTLGISWIFGLLGSLGAGIWFTYIFCITATLRGVVLFLYFIVGNKETQQLWKTLFIYFISKMLLNLKIKHNTLF